MCNFFDWIHVVFFCSFAVSETRVGCMGCPGIVSEIFLRQCVGGYFPRYTSARATLPLRHSQGYPAGILFLSFAIVTHRHFAI